jgi:hypothetical protein
VAGVRDVLTSPEYCTYPPESVVVLDEETATRDNIINALKSMCKRASTADARAFCCEQPTKATP